MDSFSHALVMLLSAVARVMLDALDWIDDTARSLMRSGGLSADLSTVVLIFVLSMFLVGVLRLLKGRLRLSVALLLCLTLAHTLERLGYGLVAS